jgi:beta-xylosidase
VDSQGRAWLYVARADPLCHLTLGSCFISAYRLSDDLLRVVGPRRILLGVSEYWERGPDYETVENPFVFEHEGTYYMLYSANDWRTEEYAMGYAVASSPVGPFVKAREPLMSTTPVVSGPGGGSVVVGPGGGHWLVYHGRRSGFGKPHERMLHIDPLVVGAGAMTTSGPTVGMDLAP